MTINTIKTDFYKMLTGCLKPSIEIAAGMALIGSGAIIWLALNQQADQHITASVLITFALSVGFMMWRYGDLEAYWYFTVKAVLVSICVALFYLLFVNTLLALMIMAGIFLSLFIIGFVIEIFKR